MFTAHMHNNVLISSYRGVIWKHNLLFMGVFGEGNKKNQGNIFRKFYQAERSLKVRKRTRN